jgi:hypothetical protein
MQRSSLVVHYTAALALEKLATLVTLKDTWGTRISCVEGNSTMRALWINEVIPQASMPHDLIQEESFQRPEKGHRVCLLISTALLA